MVQVSEDAAIAQATERLIRAFPGARPERVRDIVQQALQEFRDSTVRDYVPLLAERIAHSKLCKETGTSPSAPCLPDQLAQRHLD
jgi:hypothetical protein